MPAGSLLKSCNENFAPSVTSLQSSATRAAGVVAPAGVVFGAAITWSRLTRKRSIGTRILIAPSSALSSGAATTSA